MSTLTRFGILVLAATILSPFPPLTAQVPDGFLVVSTGNYPNVPAGVPGVYLLDPAAPGNVIPITGLPPDLAGVAPSAGANCVQRDPRTERLLCGNLVTNGGPIRAYLLTLQGSTVAASASVTLGSIPAFDSGVNGATFLPDGDLLLATGRIVSGPTANQPLLRWTPPNGANGVNGVLVPVPMPAPWSSLGNLCNAITATVDGQTAIGAFKNNGYFGALMIFDIVAIPLGGGAPIPVMTLPQGEFVTDFDWACNGELIAVTAYFPLGVGGRILTFAEQNGTWTLSSSTSYTQSGMFDFNAVAVDHATCTLHLNPNLSDYWILPAGGAPTLRSTGPTPFWGLVTGMDIKSSPEVTELPTPSPAGLLPRWAHRPFPAAPPTLGASFSMALATGPNAALSATWLATSRGLATIAGLEVYLGAGAVQLGLAAGPDPVFLLAIPNAPALRGLDVFAQAAVMDPVGGLASSDLLRATVR